MTHDLASYGDSPQAEGAEGSDEDNCIAGFH